jgi:hypothetical protein
MDKDLRKFLEFLMNIGIRERLYGNAGMSKVKLVSEYLSELEKKAVTKIVSDKYWNSYPTEKHNYHKELKIENKPFGHAILAAIRRIKLAHPGLFSLIVKKGEGLFLLGAIKCSKGKLRLKIASRAKTSKDSRLRSAALKVLPIKELEIFKSDKRLNIRKGYIGRMGIENCYTDFMKDKSEEIRFNAIANAELSEFDYQEILDAWINKEYKGSYWPIREAVESIAAQLSKDQLLFNLDLCSTDKRLRSVFQERLDSDWS